MSANTQAMSALTCLLQGPVDCGQKAIGMNGVLETMVAMTGADEEVSQVLHHFDLFVERLQLIVRRNRPHLKCILIFVTTFIFECVFFHTHMFCLRKLQADVFRVERILQGAFSLAEGF